MIWHVSISLLVYRQKLDTVSGMMQSYWIRYIHLCCVVNLSKTLYALLCLGNLICHIQRTYNSNGYILPFSMKYKSNYWCSSLASQILLCYRNQYQKKSHNNYIILYEGLPKKVCSRGNISGPLDSLLNRPF